MILQKSNRFQLAAPSPIPVQLCVEFSKELRIPNQIVAMRPWFHFTNEVPAPLRSKTVTQQTQMFRRQNCNAQIEEHSHPTCTLTPCLSMPDIDIDDCTWLGNATKSPLLLDMTMAGHLTRETSLIFEDHTANAACTSEIAINP